MWSKVGIVVLLSSLHSSHHCLPLPPATATASTAASALLSNSLPLPSDAATAAGSSPLTSLQPHAEPFGSWSAVEAAAAAHFAGGAASGASFATVRMPCEGFKGDSAGQDRIDCSFSAVCAKLRASKLYSSVHRRHAVSSCSVFACASDGVCPAPAHAGLLSSPHSNSC